MGEASPQAQLERQPTRCCVAAVRRRLATPRMCEQSLWRGLCLPGGGGGWWVAVLGWHPWATSRPPSFSHKESPRGSLHPSLR